ncbi:MAG: PadR family transcriptional regulator [Rhodospirillaceae bacterium]
MDAKTLCLGALMLGDASGYEIRKFYEDGPYSAFHAVSLGSIYPALNALLTDGLVTVCEMAQDGRPAKKVYTVTEQGKAVFMRGLEGSPGADRFRSDMLFILAFGHVLPPARRTALLDGYLEEYQRMRAELAACIDANPDVPAGRRFVRDFGLAVYEAVITYVAENRHILEDVVDDAVKEKV